MQLFSISASVMAPTPRGGVANRVVPEIYGDRTTPQVHVLVLPGNAISNAHWYNKL